jgi:hypothetical protein
LSEPLVASTPEREAAELGQGQTLRAVLLVHRFDPRQPPGVHVDQQRTEHGLLVGEVTEKGPVEGAEAAPQSTDGARDSARHLSQRLLDLLQDVPEHDVLVEDDAADLTRAATNSEATDVREPPRAVTRALDDLSSRPASACARTMAAAGVLPGGASPRGESSIWEKAEQKSRPQARKRRRGGM